MSLSAVKRVLCLHDLACAGRCSLGVVGPVLSAMGTQACLLPAALLSTHTGGFGVPACAPQTTFCSEALAHFAAQGIVFDAVYSGYLASAAQIGLVRQAIAQNPAALILIDPVLGDGGKLYSTFTPAFVREMAVLCETAACLVPNATESALLLGLAPSDAPMDDAQIMTRALALAKRFPRACAAGAIGAMGIVLTGIEHVDGRWGNVCIDPANAAPEFLPFTRAPQNYPGTGDIFASVLLGSLLHGKTLRAATLCAAAFVAAVAKATHAAHADPRHGVIFEPLLGTLFSESPANNAPERNQDDNG